MAKSLSSFLSHFPEMLSFLNFSLIASFVLLLAKSGAVAAEKSPQFDVSICKINVADPPTTFNVWSLRSDDKNWLLHRAVQQASQDSLFFALCGTLLDNDVRDGYPEHCKTQGACMKRLDGRYVSLGLPRDSALRYDAAQKELVYSITNGDQCAVDSSKSYSLSVHLKCASVETAPEWTAGYDEQCEQVVTWKTPKACVGQVDKAVVDRDDAACILKDSSGRTFDITLLSKEFSDYYLTSKNQQFYINLCRPLQDVTDGEVLKNTGAAVTTKDGKEFKSLGLYTGQLVSSNGVGFIYKMSNGSPCGTNAQISSEIEFICDNDVNVGIPTYQSNDACLYRFQWKTQYACPNRAASSSSCSLYTSNGFVDLGSLHRTQPGTNHEVIMTDAKDKKVLMNVCGELADTAHDGCRGSAVCLVDSSTSTTKKLGHKFDLVERAGDLVMTFDDGDMCREGSRSKTIIHFSCGTDVGTPALLGSLNACEYIFSWKTSAACPQKVNGWMIFFWIMFSLFLAYWVIGIAYKRFILGFRGLEMVPNIDFWMRILDKLRCRKEPEYEIQL